MQNPQATYGTEDFVTPATPLLNLVMRLRAGPEKTSDDLRETVRGELRRMEEQCKQLGYRKEQVDDVKYALVAFVDETCQAVNFPLRNEWIRKPLQIEYFDENVAGVIKKAGVEFFERLKRLLAGGEQVAGVVEVYYLCMLLGFAGKFRVYDKEGIKLVIAEAAEYLRRAGRLDAGQLSPHWKVNDQPQVPRPPGLPMWLKVGAGVGLALLVLSFVIMSFILNFNLNEAREQLLR
jgi:type VI secretion system protein ImpK